MADAKFRLKNGEQVVFPQLGITVKNGEITQSVIDVLKKKLGAEFDNHFEPTEKVEKKG